MVYWLFAIQIIFSVPVIASTESDILFGTEITTRQVVDRTCKIEAKKKCGLLEPNYTQSRLSTFLGGKTASVYVTSGNIEVNLFTSDERLFRDGVAFEGNKIFLGSGIYKSGRRELRALEGAQSVKNQLFEKLISDRYGHASLSEDQVREWRRRHPVPANISTVYKVWFETMWLGPPGRFPTGRYLGQTTITCEPR